MGAVAERSSHCSPGPGRLGWVLGVWTPKLSYNPIKEITREGNKTIEKNNAATNAVHFQTMTGDFSPGYLYGNVKSHKNGNPLRPINSQCPTPIYSQAKRLDNLLTPYIPNVYSVASSAEFLSKLKGSPTSGNIASLDVESLSTNIPVGETIDLILERVYRDPSTPTLNIPEKALRTLLEDIETLRRTFEECSYLRFTVEHSKDGRLPFLDVLISPNTTGFDTSVYIKLTNLGLCLNGDSECPTWYKASTIKAYIRRALSHCSSWAATHQELDRVAQVMVNNGYSNRQVSREIKLAMDT
ncbi:uncharacterized protein [Palaemon carinicauda]|uniref:uncharacterized protein n=1 Tax=Palaemon carinicauda TaxID=392227 RepID=UPI0035B618D1